MTGARSRHNGETVAPVVLCSSLVYPLFGQSSVTRRKLVSLLLLFFGEPVNTHKNHTFVHGSKSKLTINTSGAFLKQRRLLSPVFSLN